MSFYSRGGYGRLVRFPGMGGYGAFGAEEESGGYSVEEAQAAYNKATSAVSKLKSQIKAQQKLIDFSHRAVKNCTEDGPNIAANILSGGSTAVFCLAKEHQTLEQRKGILVVYEHDLEIAQGELANAKKNLTQAKIDAARPPPPEEDLPNLEPTAGGPGPGPTGGPGPSNAPPRPRPNSAGAGSESGGGLFDSPLKIAMVAVPVLGVLAYVMMRPAPRAAVAGYRRRNRR